MSPKFRRTALLRPLAQDSIRKTSMLVSLAVVMAASAAIPAMATEPSATPRAAVSPGNGVPCKTEQPKHKPAPGDNNDNDPCPGGGPKPPPPPVTACGPAVDSTQPNGNEQYLAALNQGVPFAGRRDVTNPESTLITSGPANAPGWTNLSLLSGFPVDSPVCDVSVDANGSDAFYKIITLDGDVYTLHCDGGGQTLVCPAPAQGQIPQSQWREVTDLPNSP